MTDNLKSIILHKAQSLYPDDHSGYVIAKSNGFQNGAQWMSIVAEQAVKAMIDDFNLSDDCFNTYMNHLTKIIENI